MNLIVHSNFFQLPRFPRPAVLQPVNPLILKVAVQAILLISFLFIFKKITLYSCEAKGEMENIRRQIALARIELQNISNAAYAAVQQLLQGPNQNQSRRRRDV